ncbi:hypothetical protein AAD018_006025 [Aestuariibius insulae]|uniref:hypothetical protein n=1 Tax=Aestuariibius insulae TaxID=2058287 RepID=UPI00345E0874
MTKEEQAAIDAFLEKTEVTRIAPSEPGETPDDGQSRSTVINLPPRPVAPHPRPRQLPSERGILEALEWAFAREKVRLEFVDQPAPKARGYGMEYVLLQRAGLGGMRIDTSIGRSSAHEDAETIAAVLADLPTELGGRRMAITIAELARTGRQPDWMPEARPRIEPVERNLKGMAKTAVLETLTVRRPMRNGLRGRSWVSRKVEVRWCPCRWHPDAAEISAARNAYIRWWMAVDWLRRKLKTEGVLRKVRLSDAMPEATPWRKVGEAKR